MATNQKSSMIKKIAEAWIGMKVAKGATKVIAPLAVAGLGYYLYNRYKGGPISSAV